MENIILPMMNLTKNFQLRGKALKNTSLVLREVTSGAVLVPLPFVVLFPTLPTGDNDGKIMLAA
jgi:hypothetical protein